MKEFHGIHQVFTYEKTETKKIHATVPLLVVYAIKPFIVECDIKPIQARYAAKLSYSRVCSQIGLTAQVGKSEEVSM
jgi:hypothetical protein